MSCLLLHVSLRPLSPLVFVLDRTKSVVVIWQSPGFQGRPFAVTTNPPLPFNLPFLLFSPATSLFNLASSGFTPFFDPPTAVKEQERMQDVGSDSGDTSRYLRIPSSGHSAVDTLTHCWYWGDLQIPGWSGVHAMDTSKIKLQLWILKIDRSTTDDLPPKRDKSLDLWASYQHGEDKNILKSGID